MEPYFWWTEEQKEIAKKVENFADELYEDGRRSRSLFLEKEISMGFS